MMMSISSYDLTLSLFYFDEEIFVNLRNELKSNFLPLNISWDQWLEIKSRTFSYHEVSIKTKLVCTFHVWIIYDCFYDHVQKKLYNSNIGINT